MNNPDNDSGPKYTIRKLPDDSNQEMIWNHRLIRTTELPDDDFDPN